MQEHSRLMVEHNKMLLAQVTPAGKAYYVVHPEARLYAEYETERFEVSVYAE